MSEIQSTPERSPTDLMLEKLAEACGKIDFEGKDPTWKKTIQRFRKASSAFGEIGRLPNDKAELARLESKGWETYVLEGEIVETMYPIVLENDGQDISSRAATVILSTAGLFDNIQRTGEQTVTKKIDEGIDNSAFREVIGSTRLGRENKDEVVHKPSEKPTVLVQLHGHSYFVHLTDEKGEWVSRENLIKKIKSLNQEQKGNGYGAITALKEQAGGVSSVLDLNKDFKNGLISSWFAVNIDSETELKPEDTANYSRDLVSGIETNRVYGKGLTISIAGAKDGGSVASLNWEHSVIDGSVAMDLSKTIASSEFLCNGNADVLINKILWNTKPDYLREKVSQYFSSRRENNKASSFTIDFGNRNLRALEGILRRDVAYQFIIQAAFQLLNDLDEIPSFPTTGEPVNTRNFPGFGNGKGSRLDIMPVDLQGMVGWYLTCIREQNEIVARYHQLDDKPSEEQWEEISLLANKTVEDMEALRHITKGMSEKHYENIMFSKQGKGLFANLLALGEQITSNINRVGPRILNVTNLVDFFTFLSPTIGEVFDPKLIASSGGGNNKGVESFGTITSTRKSKNKPTPRYAVGYQSNDETTTFSIYVRDAKYFDVNTFRQAVNYVVNNRGRIYDDEPIERK